MKPHTVRSLIVVIYTVVDWHRLPRGEAEAHHVQKIDAHVRLQFRPTPGVDSKGFVPVARAKQLDQYQRSIII
jgi:hypothetical protein